METNSFPRITYFILFITFLDLFVRSAAALPNKGVRDDEILAIIARQAEFKALDVPFTDQITVVSGSAPPVTPAPPPVITTSAAPAPPAPPPSTAAAPPPTTDPATTAVVSKPSQIVTYPNANDNDSTLHQPANTGASPPNQYQTTTSVSVEAVSLGVSTSLSRPTLRVTPTGSSSSAPSQSETAQVSTGNSFFENRTALGATFGTIGGLLVLGSVFVLWCCYSRQTVREQRTPSRGARSSFEATAGLITDDTRNTAVSMYDASTVRSEKGSFVARPGGTRRPISATPSAAVNPTNGNVETRVPPGLGVSVDPTARALVLRVPEAVKRSDLGIGKNGQATRPDNDKLSTPTLSEPRWSSSSQITHTRPISPVSPASSLPTVPPGVLLSAIPVGARSRTVSTETSSGYHHFRSSERLTLAAQGSVKDKGRERKTSVNSTLSNITKAKISAPILHAPPKIEIEIVNAFLRNSPNSASFADDGGENASPRGSADTPTSVGLGVDRWSIPASDANDPVARPDSDVNATGVDPNAVNPFGEFNLKVGKSVLEEMNREKEDGRGWSGGSLIGGIEWPDPPSSTPTSTGVWLTKH